MDDPLGEPTRCCYACGYSLRDGARFCDACGSAISTLEEPGERKQITVLFADVVESMSLATILDPERLREIMHDLFNRSAQVVKRHGGTVDKFTGDGLMALFGAPAALEDHALRACIAALEIQSEVGRLADDVRAGDDVNFRVRIGLNSGEAIAGAIGTGPGRYTAIGHTVGMAQRMEAAADPGTVLCSASTARLVERSAVLGATEWVTIKGASERVAARRLHRMETDGVALGSDDSPFVGRDSDVAVLWREFQSGHSPTAIVIGEPGVGKSRLIREVSALASSSGADVVTARCESHATQVPLLATSRLLRAMFGVRGHDAATARAHVVAQLERVGATAPIDSNILFDLLSIAESAEMAATLSADAWRRRLLELMDLLARTSTTRTLFIVEDLHWVDDASDGLLADFAATLRGTGSMLVTSCRPEYAGGLRGLSDTSITLTPLEANAVRSLAAWLLGEHPTVSRLANRIAAQAKGNPFFFEEIVRDLASRNALVGERGGYRFIGDLESVTVPATIQSVLAARIDRLSPADKSVLNAAAIIGSTFDLDVLHAVLPDAADRNLEALITAELIDRVQLPSAPRYAFRHPLVRAVAYESQLAATRAAGHRRLAAVIAMREPSAVEQNSALIAQHLEAAGQGREAYQWYMRSGEWLRPRDLVAARVSWERARVIADGLTAQHDETLDWQIAARVALTSTAWLVGGSADDESCYLSLRELATRPRDRLPLAVGMAGRVISLIVTEGQLRRAATLASELQELISGISGHVSDLAEILMAVAYAQYEACEFEQALHTTDQLRKLAAGAAAAELGPATVMSGAMKILTGNRAAGVRDLDAGVQVARASAPAMLAFCAGYKTDLVILGFDLADDVLAAETREALSAAESSSHAYGRAVARWACGSVLVRRGGSDRQAGITLLQQSRFDDLDPGGSLVDAELAEVLRQDGHGGAMIEALQSALLGEVEDGDALFGGYSLAVLVRLLVGRRAPNDLVQAGEIVTKVEKILAPVRQPALDLWPLYCRTVLADADGDAALFAETLSQYRSLAAGLDAHGHRILADQLAGASTDVTWSRARGCV